MITDRIDSTTLLTDEFRNTIIPAPKAVKIEISAKCNFNCWFCAYKDGMRPHAFMDFELYKHVLNKCYDAGFREVGLFYLGEPTLYPHLVEAIKYAKEIGFTYVFFTTNGLPITEKLMNDLIDAGLDSIKFSINSFSNEDLKESTGVGKYDKQLEILRMTRRLRDEKKSTMMIYASSIERQTDEEQEKQEASLVNVKPYVDEHYWLPLYNQASFIKGRNGQKITGGNRGRRENLRPAMPCWALFKTCHITYDGLMAACCFDHNNSFVMGDLKKNTFMECWNSEEFQKLRNAHLTNCVRGTACERCLSDFLEEEDNANS